MPYKLIYFPIFLIFLLGIVIQAHCFLGPDTSWLLHATKRFLNGGTYTTDFYEINPPMALYINIPPVLLTSFFKLSFVDSFRIYIFSIAIMSILLSDYLLKKILPAQDIIFNSVLFMLVCGYVILPGLGFGQRENIATMLVFPYLLTIVLRLLHKPVNNKLQIFISILGGLGFAIKPHFIFALAFAEIYFLLKIKKWRAIFRTDNWIIATIFGSYALSILILTPDYFKIVPYVREFFSLYLHEPYCWAQLWLNYKVFQVIGTIIFYCAVRNTLSNRTLADILLLSMIGFFLSYIVEPLYLDYHTIPMICFSLMLIALFLAEYFLHLFSQTNKFFLRFDFWVFLTVSIVILSLPSYLLYLENKVNLANKKNHVLNSLISLAQKYADGKTIYSFATVPFWTYPIVDYSNTESISRYEVDWLVPIIQHYSILKTPEAKSAYNAHKALFTKSVIADFQKNKPVLIFVDKYIDARIFDNAQFDYIKELSQTPEFKNIWKHYHYLTHVKFIEVYKRDNT